jgi:hypothetical protein
MIQARSYPVLLKHQKEITEHSWLLTLVSCHKTSWCSGYHSYFASIQGNLTIESWFGYVLPLLTFSQFSSVLLGYCNASMSNTAVFPHVLPNYQFIITCSSMVYNSRIWPALLNKCREYSYVPTTVRSGATTSSVTNLFTAIKGTSAFVQTAFSKSGISKRVTECKYVTTTCSSNGPLPSEQATGHVTTADSDHHGIYLRSVWKLRPAFGLFTENK